MATTLLINNTFTIKGAFIRIKQLWWILCTYVQNVYEQIYKFLIIIAQILDFILIISNYFLLIKIIL